MKLPFLDRKKELARLSKALQSKDPVFLVVYGRRRIGKSTLLEKSISSGDIYYCADQQNPALQITALAGEISRTISGFSDAKYPSWEVLLSTLDARIPRKITLVLDEFPFLVQMSPELPSVLQKFIDRRHKASIVICGSSQRMMQGLLLDSSAPLYGRANEIIKLYPMNPGWIEPALGVSGSNGIEAFSILGGIPRYWELAKDYRDFKIAVKELLFDRNGPLHEEPSRLLLDDIQSAAQATSLLSIIANGCNKISEVAARMQIQSTSLGRPMSNLIDLGYIKRELPFGESMKTTKRSLYKLNDPFLSFWYKFIQPNKSLLERDLVDVVFQECLKKFPGHTASVWEDLARESPAVLSIDEISWKPGSRWWGTGKNGMNMEIDIVAESFDGNALLFGEAKWENSPNVNALFDKLDRCVDNFPTTKDRRIVKAVWLKRNTGKDTKQRLIFTPEDVMKLL